MTQQPFRNRAVVVYESMYGNTRQIAEAIATGLSTSMSARAVAVADAPTIDLADLDLLVVGGPTHTWNMSRPSTRRAAVTQAAKQDSGVVVEPGAGGDGVREWLATLADVSVPAAAFDTRARAPLGLSGSAARPIARALRKSGATAAARPHGFMVTRKNCLEAGERERAVTWGRALAEGAAASVAARGAQQP